MRQPHGQSGSSGFVGAEYEVNEDLLQELVREVFDAADSAGAGLDARMVEAADGHFSLCLQS